MKNIRNIALAAHVDAGKTTLTERLLFESGAIRAQGSVDKGTTKTDDLTVEKKRGISVRSALTSTDFNGVTVNIIDTPGHADFISQVERALFAVDGIVVLVSAVDGVQTNTEIILDAAERLKKPCIIFINKADRDIADTTRVFAEIKDIFPKAALFSDISEELASVDEECLEMFVSGEKIPESVIRKKVAKYTKSLDICPVFCGSAVTGAGVSDLEGAIVDFLPSPAENEGETGGFIYAVSHDRQNGRAAYTRIYSGSLTVRQQINLGGTEYKVSMIKKPAFGKMTDTQTLYAGEVGAVYGFSEAKTGDFIGKRELISSSLPETEQALMMTAVTATDGTDILKLKAALSEIAAEEPMTDLIWEPISKSLNIKVFGNIQTEVLRDIIFERFGISVAFGPMNVIYKETPSREGFGFDAYTMPKPCWAVLKFKITPLKRGSGVVYKCSAPPNRLSYRYRKQVEESIKASIAQGPRGWEVTDLEIDLVDGEDHPIHTHPLDFTVATPLALADGFRNTGTTLLEPYIHARFTFAAEHYGRVLSDIIRMRGEPGDPVRRKDTVFLEAEIPAATSLDYSAVFASFTSGKGVMSATFSGYRVCPEPEGKTMPRRGVDPLDRSKYILAARHALSGTVFEVT